MAAPVALQASRLRRERRRWRNPISAATRADRPARRGALRCSQVRSKAASARACRVSRAIHASNSHCSTRDSPPLRRAIHSAACVSMRSFMETRRVRGENRRTSESLAPGALEPWPRPVRAAWQSRHWSNPATRRGSGLRGSGRATGQWLRRSFRTVRGLPPSRRRLAHLPRLASRASRLPAPAKKRAGDGRSCAPCCGRSKTGRPWWKRCVLVHARARVSGRIPEPGRRCRGKGKRCAGIPAAPVRAAALRRQTTPRRSAEGAARRRVGRRSEMGWAPRSREWAVHECPFKIQVPILDGSPPRTQPASMAIALLAFRGNLKGTGYSRLILYWSVPFRPQRTESRRHGWEATAPPRPGSPVAASTESGCQPVV